MPVLDDAKEVVDVIKKAAILKPSFFLVQSQEG